MKILVTGASGFIGRAFCAVARDRDHDVLPLERPSDDRRETSNLLVGTLTEPPLAAMEAYGPDAVLHLAWIATPGQYLTSPQNAVLLRESRSFLSACLRIGVPYIAVAGTCLEYAASDEPLHEQRSALDASTPYSQAKADLRDWLGSAAVDPDASWVWFRIFYPYGPGEHTARLPSQVVRSLARGESIELRSPSSVRDYIYIDDVARALCMALEEGLAGPVNVGTGTGVTVRSLALTIARTMRADPQLIRDADEAPRDPWPTQVAAAGRLLGTGWKPETGLECGLGRLARCHVTRSDPRLLHEVRDHEDRNRHRRSNL